MDVEVDDKDALRAGALRSASGHGDVIDQAKPHPLRRAGVVPRWAHEREGEARFASEHRLNRPNGGAGSHARRALRDSTHNRVGSEIAAAPRRHLLQQAKISRVVHGQEFVRGRNARGRTRQTVPHSALAQQRDDRLEAAGILRMMPGIVFQEEWIVD